MSNERKVIKHEIIDLEHNEPLVTNLTDDDGIEINQFIEYLKLKEKEFKNKYGNRDEFQVRLEIDYKYDDYKTLVLHVSSLETEDEMNKRIQTQQNIENCRLMNNIKRDLRSLKPEDRNSILDLFK